MFDVNILVNGSRCKQYQHEGKIFIESKEGSEYVIEIKNEYYKRILAVSAVDGLNVLDGKKASENDNGYIIDGYHSEKIKGFRLNDDEWARFKFGYKFNGQTYTQSKEDGSEKNCGVIGVRLFYEYEPISYTVTTNSPFWTWHNQPITWASDSQFYTSNVQYGCSSPNSNVEVGGLYGKGKFGYDAKTGQKCSLSNPIRSCGVGANQQNINYYSTMVDNSANIITQNCSYEQPKGFDMGTEPGRVETSKIQTVQFTKGYLAHTLDIYYASRESLIEMGVPITKNLKVNLPQSFPGKYCKMPDWWTRK